MVITSDDSIALQARMATDLSTDPSTDHADHVIALQARARAANTIAIYWLLMNEERYESMLEDRNGTPYEFPPSESESPTIRNLRQHNISYSYGYARHRARSRVHDWYMFREHRHQPRQGCHLPKLTLCYLVRIATCDRRTYPMIAYIDPNTLPSSTGLYSSLHQDPTVTPTTAPTAASAPSDHTAAPQLPYEPPPYASPPPEMPPEMPSPPPSPPGLRLTPRQPPSSLGSPPQSGSTPLYRLSMYLEILSPPPRHPRQSAANHAFNLRCARRSAAVNLILHISRRTWRILGFIYRLQRPARFRAARRSTALQLISKSPTPLLGYDLGYSDVSNDLVIRSPTGIFITHHPSNPNLSLTDIPAYSPTGDRIPPLVPPANSRLVMCPEPSGSWCYYHVDHGSATWHIPTNLTQSSSPLASATLPTLAAFTADASPPRLDCRLTLDTLERNTPWLPLYSDSDHVITLYHRTTGCTREAPWFTMREHGRIYFANIISGETRWAPPLSWLDGWLARDSPFDRRSTYARNLLPPSLARMHVEGGAAYLDSTGVPRYDSESSEPSDVNSS